MSEIEKAKAALEPFAGIADWLSAQWRDHDEQWPDALNSDLSGDSHRMLTVGDLRRAREALSALQAPSAPAEMGVGSLPKFVYSSVTPKFKDDSDEIDHLECWIHATITGMDQEELYERAKDIQARIAALSNAPAPDAEKDEIARLTRRTAMLEKSAGFATDDVARLEDEIARLTRERDEAVERADLNDQLRIAHAVRATELEDQVAALVEVLGKARVALAGYTSADDAAYTIDVALGSLGRALNGQEAGR